MRAVNLLPPERRGRGGSQAFALQFTGQPLLLGVVGIVVATVLAIGLWAHSASSGLSGKEDRLASLQRELAVANRADSSSAATPTSVSRLNDVVSLASNRMPWDAFLGGFARVVPEDVWLLSLTANPVGTAGTPSTVATSSTPAATPLSSSSPVTISGYTYSQASVARMIDRLTLIPWLSDVQLQNSTLTQLGNRLVYQFAIGASMVNTGEGVAS